MHRRISSALHQDALLMRIPTPLLRRDLENKQLDQMERAGRTLLDSDVVYDPLRAALGQRPQIQGRRNPNAAVSEDDDDEEDEEDEEEEEERHERPAKRTAYDLNNIPVGG